MKDNFDLNTPDLYEHSKPKRGRPKTGCAKTDAQRSAEYRKRKAAMLAERTDPKRLPKSEIIALDALPPWRRS